MLRRFQLHRLKIASQFTLILSIIFIVGVGLGGFALSQALENKTLAEMNARAEMAVYIANSVRSYTSNDIAPLINQFTNTQTEFIPETIPSIAAKRVFEGFKTNWKYKDLIYKEATLNPTNLDDRANRFEAKLIENFESDRTVKSLSGYRFQAGEKLFYSAQPLAVTNSSCLRCHSTPEVAPKSMVERYGRHNGFGWKLNQVIGTQIIYIPASQVLLNARKAIFLFITIFIVIFALAITSINYWLKNRVLQPLKPMAKIAEIISLDNVSVNELRVLEHQELTKISQRQDELGKLGRIFQNMVREMCDRQQKLSQQLQQLQVEVDRTKINHQVSEIMETDYFQKLQQTAKEIRNQHLTPNPSPYQGEGR
ncbi:MAG: DUF3365 domain-containing protein [Rivularia sp. (in: cyanobacteria)]